MTNLAKLTKAQLIAQIEDLRTKYSDLSIGYDQLLHDVSVLEMEVKDAEALRTKYNDLAAARQGTSRQELSSQRWETMQKAKALAMSSGRSVKCSALRSKSDAAARRHL